MKKLFVMLAMVASFSAFAEPTFQQIEGLIEQRQYQSAAMGLEEIIKNHPNSAKAYYAMAQAQAGLGNLEKAQFALNKARGFDPELKFASSSNVESLQQAITPQVKKIEVVEESHFWRNLLITLVVLGGMTALFLWYVRKEDEGKASANSDPKPKSPAPDDYHAASPSDQAYMREHNMAPKPKRYDPGVTAQQTVQSAPAASPAPAPTHTTIVNNSNDGFVTGMLVGNMLSGSHHHDHHDTTIIRETVREVPAAPAPAVESTWRETPSKSSTWDDDSSPSVSSSWSSSSSSRSSSWDSDSSSSSSSSSWSSSSDTDSSWSSSDSGSSWD